jgi:CubicO group peptidase (beta-lactamase class C family)
MVLSEIFSLPSDYPCASGWVIMNRSLPLIATLLALPSLAIALAACGDAASIPAPLSEAALAAVTDDAGAPKRELAREVDDLIVLPDLGETRALVVIHNGKIAAERYADGYDENTRFVSWSMAKTITAIMIGMMVADGKLSMDQSAPVPQWQRPGDARGEITLRQLLQMRSGLRHSEASNPPYESAEVRMLFLDGRDNMAKWAEEQPLEAEPGAVFEYSSNTTVILADIAADVLTSSTDPDIRRQAVTDYLNARLFEPLKMGSMVPEFDAAGTLIGGSLIHGNARDWAKLGEMLRRKGKAPTGEQLVPRRWVEQMVTPSPRSPQYGFQTWLNRPIDDAEAQHPLFPDRAPNSVFALIGHMGQYVIVSPEQRLTVVRLGHSTREDRVRMVQQLADIFEIYPVR